MNFSAFWHALSGLQRTITITSPITSTVKRAHWGAPPEALGDLPAVINALSEPDRTLGFGGRDQIIRVNVQLMAARASSEDPRSSQIATAFWFSAKDAFDRDTSIGGTVSFSTLRGAEPTVPVILLHGGQAYFGFNAFLEVRDISAFEFQGVG